MTVFSPTRCVWSLLFLLAVGVVLFISVTVFDDPLGFNRHRVRRVRELDSLSSSCNEETTRRLIATSLIAAYNGRRDGHLSFFEAYPYASLFQEYSKHYKIDWEVYGALIWVESQYDPSRKSNRNCKGMSQLSESTAKAMACSLGIFYERDRTVWNDMLNITLGLCYLSKSIKKYNVKRGLKIYIGGEGFSETNSDVIQYWGAVYNEYLRLQFIHKGVLESYCDKTPPTLGDFLDRKNSNGIRKKPRRGIKRIAP